MTKEAIMPFQPQGNQKTVLSFRWTLDAIRRDAVWAQKVAGMRLGFWAFYCVLR